MADEAAVIEAPPEIEAPAIAEDAVESTPTEETTQEATESTEGEGLRGSALWREVKSATQANKPLTPQQLSALNKVIHKAQALDTKYPDGLTSLDGAMSAVRQLSEDQSLPIADVIQQTIQERNYFREFDSLFTSGKPEFVQKLADASPEAFQNIAPSVFRKYAEVNPDGYATYVSQAVVQHMNSAGVPTHFQVLEAFWPQIPDFPGKQQFQKALASVMGWTDTLTQLAGRKIEQKALPQPEAGPDRESQLAEREQSIMVTEWNSSLRDQSTSYTLSEIDKAAGTRKLTEKERQDALTKAKEEYTARVQGNRGLTDTLNGYVRAKNKGSFTQRIESEQKKLIPGAARRAVDDVLAARPKAAPRAEGVTLPKKTAAPELQGAPQARWIGEGHPKTKGLEVDLNRTTQPMLIKRQAYLKGQAGLVTWGKRSN